MATALLEAPKRLSTADIIEDYLINILKPQLTAVNVPEDFATRILNTVRTQMQSLIYHWGEEEYRKAFLIIGADEGTFYKPHTHGDIRNFVVVTVRNSDIECLHSPDYRLYGLTERLSEKTIRQITSAAIEYFSKLDFNKLYGECGEPENDIYSNLADKYPVTIEVLRELAKTKRITHDFERIPVYNQPTLDELPIAFEKQSVAKVNFGEIIEAFSDGYAFSIGADAKAHLLDCEENRFPFVVDSFKSLTRNVSKLMLIMEFLLSRWLPLTTTNYLIMNGHIERRPKLLKAASTHEDMFKNWKQTADLGKLHKLFLEKTIEQIKK